MDFLVSSNTDVGAVKTTNQDSLSALVLGTPQGKMVFTVLCDGMGGLEHGELASASVVRTFRNWATTILPELCQEPLEDAVIRQHWQGIVTEMNKRIQEYSAEKQTRMGTTAVVMLLTQGRYYIMNVGDSRAYELTDHICQLTEDHSVVARELNAGRITPEEAEHHPKRNVLTQCVGASKEVYGDMFFGRVKKNAVYMLCSDGFRHEISPDELYDILQPGVLRNEHAMRENAQKLIALNKQRGEDDNISVVLVRTF